MSPGLAAFIVLSWGVAFYLGRLHGYNKGFYDGKEVGLRLAK